MLNDVSLKSSQTLGKGCFIWEANRWFNMKRRLKDCSSHNVATLKKQKVNHLNSRRKPSHKLTIKIPGHKLQSRSKSRVPIEFEVASEQHRRSGICLWVWIDPPQVELIIAKDISIRKQPLLLCFPNEISLSTSFSWSGCFQKMLILWGSGWPSTQTRIILLHKSS